MEEYLTVQQAAERKGVRATTIYSAIERGELPCQIVLGRKGVRPSDVEAYQPGSYGGITRAKRRRGPIKKGAVVGGKQSATDD